MPGKIINVSTAAQLSAAIAGAKGGETILLAAGNYGSVSVKGRLLTDLVTIKSADASNDAVLRDLRVDRSSGFRFEDVDIVRPLAAGEADTTVAAFVSSSSNIQFAGVDFRGSMDGNAANDGIGLRITTSQNVALTGSTFEQFKNAVTLSDLNGAEVRGNTLTGVAKSFNLAGLQNATFADNQFLGVKPDWSTTAFAGKNVQFLNNFVSGDAAVSVAAGPKTINVATTAQLNAAIAAAKGGETILLAPGDYGYVNVKGKAMTSTVTIKSADSANDAVISDLRIDKSSGFTFSDIDIHRPLKPGEAEYTQAAYISGSSKINFIGVDFSGSLDNNAWNDGVGLRVSYSNSVTVLDSSFEQWTNAANFDHNTGLVIAGNSVTTVREGFDFAAVHDVTIARNLFTAFQPKYSAGDHADAVQVWTAGVQEGSSNLVIRDNVVLAGASGGVQGFFVTSQDAQYRHSNVTIENNLYNGDSRHGITVMSTDGVVIRGNTVTSAPGGVLESGINVSSDSNVRVERNVAPLLLDGGKNTGLAWVANVDLWDSKTRVGVSLDSIFAAPGGGKGTDIAAYALKTAGGAGFALVDGIGPVSFDLAHAGSYGHLAPLLAQIA